jgi:hypothetical protein
MTVLDIVLMILRIANTILNTINQDKLIQQGRDQEIAEAATAILRKTAAGKAIMAKVDAMDDATVDAELRKLEPQ